MRRASYLILCTVLFLASILAGIRPLRISGLYQTIGILLFAMIVFSAWKLAALSISGGAKEEQRLAFAGTFFLVPFALISLLWVGLGPPFAATPAENVMRYGVLLASSIAISFGFILLKETLGEANERTYSTLAFAAALLAGAAYLIWMSFALGASVARLRDGHFPSIIVSLSEVLDILLFVAGALTYLATGVFAASFGQIRWLGRNATRGYVIANLMALIFLVVRGMSFPDPAALTTPWYTQPGFIAGIPAVPFIMPFLLGVVLLRRAGDESAKSSPSM